MCVNVAVPKSLFVSSWQLQKKFILNGCHRGNPIFHCSKWNCHSDTKKHFFLLKILDTSSEWISLLLSQLCKSMNCIIARFSFFPRPLWTIMSSYYYLRASFQRYRFSILATLVHKWLYWFDHRPILLHWNSTSTRTRVHWWNRDCWWSQKISATVLQYSVK